MYMEHDGWFGKPGFGPGGLKGPRMQRGDLGPIILHLLQEKPMHGYEVMRTLEERSHGFWRPSAGSVYPTLQMLEEQGLVSSRDEDGKKTYSLTEQGTEQACKPGADNPWHGNPWKDKHKMGARFRDMGPTVRRIGLAFKKIAFDGTEEQVREAKAILAEAAERLSKLAGTHGDPDTKY